MAIELQEEVLEIIYDEMSMDPPAFKLNNEYFIKPVDEENIPNINELMKADYINIFAVSNDRIRENGRYGGLINILFYDKHNNVFNYVWENKKFILRS